MIVVPTWTFQNQQLERNAPMMVKACVVRTIISFLNRRVMKADGLIVDDEPTIVTYLKDVKDEHYGFEVEVDFSKDEYEKNKYNIEEYACKKVKEKDAYKNAIDKCIKNYANGRDYTVETFVTKIQF